MELKIRIKEVKEEWRQLTELETLLTELSRLNQVPESYKDKLKEQLKSRGITGYDISSGRILGLFRTETTRDATPEEVIAWHCIQIRSECDKIKGNECMICPKYMGCIVSKEHRKSKVLLLGKEVILELV